MESEMRVTTTELIT